MSETTARHILTGINALLGIGLGSAAAYDIYTNNVDAGTILKGVAGIAITGVAMAGNEILGRPQTTDQPDQEPY